MNLWRVLFALIGVSSFVYGVEKPKGDVPISISDPHGSFQGVMRVSFAGPSSRVKAEWHAKIKNTSPHKVYQVTFCVQAFDDSGGIRVGGDECAIRMWGNNWDPGADLTFKGNQKAKVADGDAAVAAKRFEIKVLEIYDTPPNLREIKAPCQITWPEMLRVFADNKFRPTVVERDSLMATFAYDGGQLNSGGTRVAIQSFTTATTSALGPFWSAFRIDSASMYLRQTDPATCSAEIKMSFAGFATPLLAKYGTWQVVNSNFSLEKVLLDGIVRAAEKAASADLDRAIDRLPSAPAAETPVASVHLAVTSDPPGAEIEVNGEFVGSTPTSLTTMPGAIEISLKKNGYQTWTRKLKVQPGDQRSLHGELSKP